MGQKTSETKTTQESPYTPSQKKWQNIALELYGPQLGKGEDVFQGLRVAGFSPGQEQSLANIGGFADYFKPGGEMPLFGETGTALSGILSGQTGAAPITPEATEKYFQTSIQQPSTRYFEENYLPAVREAWAGPGSFWHTGRAKAETEAGEDLWRYLGEKRGQLEWDVGEANRAIEEAKAQRSLAATPLGMQYGAMPTAEAQQRLAGQAGVFAALEPERALRQQEIAAAMQKFAEETRITGSEDLAIIMHLLGQPYGTSRGTEATYDPLYWLKFGTAAAGSF